MVASRGYWSGPARLQASGYGERNLCRIPMILWAPPEGVTSAPRARRVRNRHTNHNTMTIAPVHIDALKALGYTECSQPSGRPKLRNGFQFLEGRGERVRQAPHSPRRELLMLRIEVVIMHHSRQVLGYFKFSLDEGSIDDELRGFIRKLACAPGFNLPAHRLEVALHAVHPHREDV